MNKNTFIGFFLIILVFIGFNYINQPTPEQKQALQRYRDSIAAVQYQQQLEYERSLQQATNNSINEDVNDDSIVNIQLQNQYGEFAGSVQGEENFITLENELVEVILSTKGGRVYSVRLKQYTDKDDQELVLFDKDESSFNVTLVTHSNRIIETKDLYFDIIKEGNRVVMQLQTANDASLDFIYTLPQDDYMLGFEVKSNGLQNNVLSLGNNSLDIQWTQKIRQQETGRSFEGRYARLSYKFLSDDMEQLSESKDDSKSIPNKLKWVAFKDQYFSSVLIADESLEISKVESRFFSGGRYMKEYKLTTAVAFDVYGVSSSNFNFYFGPNDYALLKKYDKNQFKGQELNLERLVPLGWSLFRYVNKWIIIPLFDFWTTICGNIGIAILLLTFTIKTLLFPLSYKSFMSSAKMRVMRPQIEEINKKYPGQDQALTRQQKTMELYKQAGVNPMSGCLPMLLQMPFLFALFMFFPSAIELRHEGFLWANDLSTYDAVISWNANIPLISKYFGNHISLFCLLMTVTQIIYTKFNMEQTNTGQQQMPGMKLMMYFLPLFMLVFLNQYPSGLNFYYFISTLITIIQTVGFRIFVNEDKLLAKLEANKKNPKVKKKSGFMARLEEAQRQQQALAKQRAQQQQKGGKRR